MGGLSLSELVVRTGHDRRVLEVVMREEVARGHVALTNGRFAIVPGALSPDVAAALRGLSAPDVGMAVNGGRRRQPGGGRVRPSEQKNLSWAVY
jgi:hypothetical protein